MKTFSAKPDEVNRQWHVVDAAGRPLGRLAVEVAILLRGKHKPTYTPHVDSGDFVVVINADKVIVTGKKPTQKLYRKHSGHPGGLKTFTFNQMMQRDATKVVEAAVWGMIPHNRLGNRQITKLKVYKGAAHPHGAQQPAEFVLPAHVAQSA
jgi:large subunit ribosomal protein L13